MKRITSETIVLTVVGPCDNFIGLLSQTTEADEEFNRKEDEEEKGKPTTSGKETTSLL